MGVRVQHRMGLEGAGGAPGGAGCTEEGVECVQEVLGELWGAGWGVCRWSGGTQGVASTPGVLGTWAWCVCGESAGA